MTLLDGLDPDIISLCETHLNSDENNDILEHKYAAYYYSRRYTNVNARRHFGGVAVFVKRTLFNDYNVYVVDKYKDGILALKFID